MGFICKLTIVVATIALVGCASVPRKQETKLAPYNSVVVRDLVIEESCLDKIQGEELVEFNKARPELIKAFNDKFRATLANNNLFERIVLNGQQAPNAIVVEPKASLIDPGIRMLMQSRSVIVVKVSDAATGNLLGSYNVSRSSNRPAWSTMMGVIKGDITDLGEDAGQQITALK